MDNTTIHPASEAIAHLTDRFLWRGPPLNRDATRPIQILVNHGYVVGFCPDRLQPAWSAYQITHKTDDIDFDRPHLYYDDQRLPKEHRIGPAELGKFGESPLVVGQMTPSEIIHRQFGRLAQLETFFLSNASPQYASLNRGVWLKLETAILELERGDERKEGEGHGWVIVGPIFGENAPSIGRAGGKHVPIAKSFFCIVVEPHASNEPHLPLNEPHDADEPRAHREPHLPPNEPCDSNELHDADEPCDADGAPSQVHVDCFIIPQNAPRDSRPEDYPATLEDIERATHLEFFQGFGRSDPARHPETKQKERASGSQLRRVLDNSAHQAAGQFLDETGGTRATSINNLIDELHREADAIVATGDFGTEDLARLRTIQHTMSYLVRARALLQPTKPPPPPNLITYKVVSDLGGKLKQAARTACNFWNRFVKPQQSIVLRLCTFTQNDDTVTLAYQPYSHTPRSSGAHSTTPHTPHTPHTPGAHSTTPHTPHSSGAHSTTLHTPHSSDAHSTTPHTPGADSTTPHSNSPHANDSHSNGTVIYYRVEFNTKYLATVSDEEIVGTIVHEIGHALGVGRQEWDRLYDSFTRKFNFEAVRRVPALAEMEVKRGPVPGTVYSHWDDLRFRTELMAAYKNPIERVLPVTIDVMELLGHEVTERLPVEASLSELLREASGAIFTLQSEVLEHLNLDYFVPTEVAEVISRVGRRRER